MAKLTVKSGSASRSEYIFINDASSTTGAGLTGLVFNSAGLTAYYVTERGTPTVITLVTLASATAAYTSGGFIAVDATNMPGVYRVDIPSAVFATTKGVVMLKGATNMVPVLLEYDVVSYDPTDTVRLGLTAIPNVAQGSAGAIPTGSATGQVTVATNNDKTGYSLTQAFPTNFSSLAITVGGAVTAGTVSDKTGYSLATAPPTAAAIATQVWSEALPGAYTSGQAGFKLDAGTATNVWAAATRTLTAGTNIVLAKGTGITGFNDITAQSVWDTATSGLVTAGSIGLKLNTNVDTTVSSRMATFTYTTPPTTAAIATQVWSEALPGTYTSGQAGFKLNAAGSAADPWATALPGSYAAGSAGNIIGNRLDAAVSSRMATFTLPTNFSTLAISGTGAVTAGTVSDKTGYSLSVAPPTAAAISTQVWSDTTRTLTSGANIALAKGTGITGFNDITSQSVWDVLASSVSLTNSIGLQLKTNIDAAISSRMATFSLPTNFSVLGITAGGAVTAGTVSDKTGYSLSGSQTFSTTGSVGSVTNPVTAGTVSDKTGYSLSQSFPANFSALSITAGTGYVTSTNGGGGGSAASVRPGPFLLRAGNGIAGDPLDVQKGSVASIDLQCVDANSTGVDITGATVTTKVYNTAGTLVATYTNTSSYSAGGRTLCPLDATVTGTAGTYTANVWVVNGSNTTIYGPLRLYVRDI